MKSLYDPYKSGTTTKNSKFMIIDKICVEKGKTQVYTSTSSQKLSIKNYIILHGEYYVY